MKAMEDEKKKDDQIHAMMNFEEYRNSMFEQEYLCKFTVEKI